MDKSEMPVSNQRFPGSKRARLDKNTMTASHGAESRTGKLFSITQQRDAPSCGRALTIGAHRCVLDQIHLTAVLGLLFLTQTYPLPSFASAYCPAGQLVNVQSSSQLSSSGLVVLGRAESKTKR
eukprot:6186407-Pleurochrysis_carterae.AAC.1